MTARTLVDYDRLWQVLGAESEVLAVSVRGARVESVIPGCPGLTLGEAARHVGSQYRMIWQWLRDGRRPGNWQREPAAGQELADYIRSGAAPILAELAAHQPDEPCPTWWQEEQHYGFWRRRLAHETTVHRYDVQGAAGMIPDEVPDDIALDGIDEVLTLWFGHRLDVLGVSGTRDQVVAVQAAELEWLTRAGIEHTSTHRPGDPNDGAVTVDATVSGSPMEIYLWLWGRRPDRAVDMDGNQDAIAQLWALLRLATR
ncbi:MAG TPA: maleylpyruvate isomerase family mycothiol-dependent enzyme [Pseudonocardiaceae bacterium]|nr:maleylpyruvate isomerase family mycothiol-dependent enzyme [Pseudonocardiaceae bacterium]